MDARIEAGPRQAAGNRHELRRLRSRVRARLAILAVLVEAGRADFGFLKTTLELTDGNLGRHLAILADAGLVTLTKGPYGRRRRTWAVITPAGRRALVAELRSMKALLARLDDGADPEG